jgi:hypothetical protein
MSTLSRCGLTCVKRAPGDVLNKLTGHNYEYPSAQVEMICPDERKQR